jgi:hypothetical protein
MEQACPRRLAFGEIKAVGEWSGSGDAGAGDAVVEVQQPDPATIEAVVDSSVFRRVGEESAIARRAEFGWPSDSGEVAVKCLGRWVADERSLVELQ